MKKVRIVLTRDLRDFERVDFDTERIFSNMYVVNGLLIAIARSLGHLNGRRLHAIEKINDSSKKCQCYRIDFQSVKDMIVNGVRSCKCDNNARYRLVFNYVNKYYGVYLCEEHFKQAMLLSVNKMVSRLYSIIENLVDYAVYLDMTKTGHHDNDEGGVIYGE